jgi:hypothetical protein
MRVRVLWLLFALSFLVPFAGCGVPQETYDNLVQENATLQENHQNLETQQAVLDDKFTNLEDRHLAL